MRSAERRILNSVRLIVHPRRDIVISREYIKLQLCLAGKIEGTRSNGTLTLTWGTTARWPRGRCGASTFRLRTPRKAMMGWFALRCEATGRVADAAGKAPELQSPRKAMGVSRFGLKLNPPTPLFCVDATSEYPWQRSVLLVPRY